MGVYYCKVGVYYYKKGVSIIKCVFTIIKMVFTITRRIFIVTETNNSCRCKNFQKRRTLFNIFYHFFNYDSIMKCLLKVQRYHLSFPPLLPLLSKCLIYSFYFHNFRQYSEHHHLQLLPLRFLINFFRKFSWRSKRG